MRPPRIVVVFALLLLAGCKMGPNYRRPAADVGVQFRGAATTDTTSLADLPWWEVFRDRQLQDYIREALDNNRDLSIAIARVAEARAIVGITRADLFPQIFGNATASRTRLSEQTHGRQSRATGTITTPAGGAGTFVITTDKQDLYVNLYQATLDLAYEIDLWGRLRRSSEAARANLLATEYARRTVVSSLVADVATNYFQLRELDLELQIAERTFETRAESERLIRMRFEYGRANGLDLDRAVGETASTGAAIAQIQRALAQTENALCVLLGRNPGELRRGAALTAQPALPDVPPGLPASLIDRRPDVLQAEAGLIAANAQVGAAKALFFPRISLTGLLGFESDELDDWFAHRAHTWTVAGNLSQPIFQGGRFYFNYKAVQARREEALTFYLATIQQSLREVADALAARKYSVLEREQREIQVEALVHASELANRRYEGGRSDYLDVLDAERAQFSAELQLAQTELAELVSLVRLYRALGGGWNAELRN